MYAPFDSLDIATTRIHHPHGTRCTTSPEEESTTPPAGLPRMTSQLGRGCLERLRVALDVYEGRASPPGVRTTPGWATDAGPSSPSPPLLDPAMGVHDGPTRAQGIARLVPDSTPGPAQGRSVCKTGATPASHRPKDQETWGARRSAEQQGQAGAPAQRRFMKCPTPGLHADPDRRSALLTPRHPPPLEHWNAHSLHPTAARGSATGADGGEGRESNDGSRPCRGTLSKHADGVAMCRCRSPSAGRCNWAICDGAACGTRSDCTSHIDAPLIALAHSSATGRVSARPAGPPW
jgi:hypothetical protein